MWQDAPRNDVDPDDGLLDFHSEAPNTALDKKESDVAFNRSEPDAPLDKKESGVAFNKSEPDAPPEGREPVVILDGRDPVVIFDSREQNVPFGSEEPDSAFGRKRLSRQERAITSSIAKLDIQPDVHELPLHAPSVQPFVRYQSPPVVRKRASLSIGIGVLMLGSIGALAWSDSLSMVMRPDAGTWGAQVQNASQPTPTEPPEGPTPTSVLPPVPDPQPPATDVPAEVATSSEPAIPIATPSEAPGANPPDAPRAERPVRQAERLPVNADPNAAGGLFAITRPVGAQVFLDNKLIGTTPFFLSQLSSGSHEVRLELPGFRTYSSSIQVEPNRRFRLAVQLEETR
jgi:hypothetical protein